MQKQRATINDVKREVESYRGCRIKLEAHKSKKKLYHKEGVIEGTYPSIFTVKVKEEKRAPQRLSFSYSDVLIRSVKIDLLDTEIEGAFTY
ncbi:Veg family protein [Eubacterium aggregans]|uniref:Veg family protein n=1 Tax=Eubacterium aggregans TaxID=81409 RepID=UPI003F371645